MCMPCFKVLGGSGMLIGKGLCGFSYLDTIVEDHCLHSWLACVCAVQAITSALHVRDNQPHACMFRMNIGSVFLTALILRFVHLPALSFNMYQYDHYKSNKNCFYPQTIFPEPQPRKSDVFHLAANLIDRYLGYYPPSTEGEFRTVASACTMISVKLRRSREEALSYDSLRPHFYDISEKEVRVSCKLLSVWRGSLILYSGGQFQRFFDFLKA